MKSPRAAAHPCPLSRQAAQMIIGDTPVPIAIGMTIKNQQALGCALKMNI
jgi:hypothetical protein